MQITFPRQQQELDQESRPVLFSHLRRTLPQDHPTWQTLNYVGRGRTFPIAKHFYLEIATDDPVDWMEGKKDFMERGINKKVRLFWVGGVY